MVRMEYAGFEYKYAVKKQGTESASIFRTVRNVDALSQAVNYTCPSNCFRLFPHALLPPGKQYAVQTKLACRAISSFAVVFYHH